VAWDSEHFTTPAADEEGGKFNERDQYFQVSLCLRSRLLGLGYTVLAHTRCWRKVQAHGTGGHQPTRSRTLEAVLFALDT
jgi:hypothetical protein